MELKNKNLAEAICAQRSFTLKGPLGSGAHKQAYLIDRAGKEFALKIAVTTPDLKPRFEREAAALADCSHVAIAKLHESGAFTLDGTEYWVSVEEFLAGGTLETRLSPGALTLEQIRAIGLRLADALGHLQSKGLVHRDIKPANILFRDADNAVLTDFGIVRVLDAPTLTKAFVGMGPGTPLYAAPEQLTNQQELIDWRTDQFGLAVVIAQCALGFHPFSPENIDHLAITRVAQHELLPQLSKSRLTALGLGGLIRALSPWPVQRYRSPIDFQLALSTTKEK